MYKVQARIYSFSITVLFCLISMLACDSGDKGDMKSVVFLTEDRVEIHGALFEASVDAPVILLLHQLGSSKESWERFSLDFQTQGFNVLAIDLRGHGESTLQDGEEISYEDFEEKDYENMLLDVAAAVRFIQTETEIESSVMDIAGASIGANLTLTYAATDSNVTTIALLSPGFNYRVPLSQDSMVEYGNRPVIIMASLEDGQAASDAATLDDLAQHPDHSLNLYEGADHGIEILNDHDDAKALFFSWFATYREK